MDKKLLNYTIAGVSIAIASFVIIQLTSTEDVQSKVSNSTIQSLEPIKSTNVVAPVKLIPKVSLDASSKHSPDEDKHDHDSEFYTEMMPKKVKQEATSSLPKPPQNDNDRLGYILDADFAPVIDVTGTFSGLKISGLPEALSGLSSLHVKNGDVVTQINETKIVDEESFGVAIERLYSRGQDSGSITFEIDRDGAYHSVALNIEP